MVPLFRFRRVESERRKPVSAVMSLLIASETSEVPRSRASAPCASLATRFELSAFCICKKDGERGADGARVNGEADVGMSDDAAGEKACEEEVGLRREDDAG